MEAMTPHSENELVLDRRVQRVWLLCGIGRGTYGW